MDDDIRRHLVHLQVERRLSERSLTIYAAAFTRLQGFAARAGVDLREVQVPHVRRWAAQLHSQGLGPRSIALVLSAWRGLYRWLGLDAQVALNPVDGVRAPKAAKPLPSALSVDHAVALAAADIEVHAIDGSKRGHAHLAAITARDACIVELLYGCGLRVAELIALDTRAGPAASAWIDAADASAHVLGKGSKRRSVPVGTAALQALQT